MFNEFLWRGENAGCLWGCSTKWANFDMQEGAWHGFSGFLGTPDRNFGGG